MNWKPTPCWSIVSWLVLSIATAIDPGAVAAQADVPSFINGVDASFIDHYEKNGVVFTDEGVPADPLETFKSNGINTIRLRLWHTPTPEHEYNGLERTLQMAKRVKEAGLTFFLDFHYSDWWADPGKQNKPALWAGAPFWILKDSLQAYTQLVVERMSAQGTLPEIIQIGNEVTVGMLWNDGKVGGSFDTSEQWQKFAELIQVADSGIVAGLGEGDIKPAIMIHIDRGGDPAGAEWFFSNLVARGIDFDLIGLSYYSFWHGPMSRLERTLRTLAIRYEKDLVVAEAAYPWTLQGFDDQNNFVWAPNQLHAGYPASVDGQFRFLRDLKALIKATPDGRGRGVVWWEPGHIAAPGLRSSWENLTLFDNNADALESMAAFDDSNPVSNEPAEMPLGSVRLQPINYPNPFSETTTIRYELAEPDDVVISAFDVTGRRVASLSIETFQTAGFNEVQLDGSKLSPGIYLVKIEGQTTGQAHKIILHRD